MSNKSDYRPLLRQRNFMISLVAGTISRFGDSLDAIAFSWLVYQITGDAALIAIVFTVNFLPTILLQPLAGPLCERLPKTRVIAVCNAARGLCVCAGALLYLSDMLTVGLLIAMVLFNSTVEAVETPAGSALSKLILPKELYTLGAALRGGASRAAELVGMACAGGLIALVGSPAALMIDAGTFLLYAVCMLFIRTQETPSREPLGLSLYFQDLKAGVRYAASNPAVRALMLVGAFLNFSATPLSTFQTVYIAESLDMGPEMLSAAGLALTAATALGSLLLPKLQSRLPRHTLITLSGVLSALVFILLGLLPRLGAAGRLAGLLGTMAVLGLTSGILNVSFSAAFMEHVDGDYMARISGLTNAVLCSMMPVCSLLCAALAAVVTVPQLFLYLSGLSLLLLLSVTRSRGYRAL